MNQRIIFLVGFPALWIVLWGLLGAVSVGMRPVLPGFELTALAGAWDMWQRGAFLVPGNQVDAAGAVFPLYLWLIHGTWSLFGVSDVWPRLLSPALGLGSTFMIAALCRAIWPGWSGLGALGATLASGVIGWLLLASVAGAQVLLMLCILVALYGVMIGWRRGTWDGIVLTGLGLGLGFLTAGPSILAHVLPVALLTPIWAPALGWAHADGAPVSDWRHWYARFAISFVIGIAIFAAWLVPYGMETGVSAVTSLALTSLNAVADGTGGRAYLLALFLLPWIIWPPAWRALGGLWSLLKDGGGRFCLIWLLSSVVVYAVMPGRQLLDIALLVPAVAMIAAYLLYLRIDPEMARQETERRFGNGEAVLGLLVALMGLVLIVAPLAGGLVFLPWWVEGLSGSWGFVLIAIAALMAYAAPRMVIFRAALVTSQMTLAVLVGMLAASPVMNTQANVHPAAMHLRQALGQDIAVAFAGPYGYQFDFPARLEQPLDVLDPEDSIGVVAWAAGHEGGQIALIMDQLFMGAKPSAVFPYLGQYIVFWPTEIIAEQPGIVVGPKAPTSDPG